MSRLLGLDPAGIRSIGSDEPVSPLSSEISGNTDEMLEAEDAGLPVRVFDLEKLVRDQQDEITFLKSTVADLQRRLNVVDGARAVNKLTAEQIRPSPNRLGNGVYSNGLHGGYDRGDGQRRRPVSAQQSRRAHHYQSTSSLHSDGRSSNSNSPVTSPSPAAAQQRHLRNTAQQRHLQTTNANLNKRWSSTSDFQSTRRSPAPNPSPAPVVNLRQRTQPRRAARPVSFAGVGVGVDAGVGLGPGVGVTCPVHDRPESLYLFRDDEYGNLLHTPRRPLGGSMTNLARPATGTPARIRTKDMTYSAEEGVLKVFLRGRPVNLYAPSAVQQNYDVTASIPAPQQKLKLEWAYGYRGKDCRNNLYLLPTGETVYFVAGVVVLYNMEDQMQRHYTGHTDDVKCLAVHPNRFTIASGQCAGTNVDAQAQVRVWDSVSLHTLHVLGAAELDRSVSCLAFSQLDGGALLACVDEGLERTLSVWDWQKGLKLTENKASNEAVLDVEWHPLDRGVLMTCGRQHVSFWLLEAGSLMRRQGVFGGRDRPKYVTCMAFTDTGDLITGDSEGRILLWERGGNQVARTVKGAHEGAVFTLLVDKTGGVVSGGKDGRIVQWDRGLTRTGNVLQLPEELGSPRIVSQGRGSRLLIGTTRNCILTGDWTVLPRTVVRGHTDELWALALHPGRPQFVTAGWDGLLVCWDLMTHAPVWDLNLGEGVQCACFSPDGSRLVVGLVSGRWDLLDADTRETVCSRTDGQEAVQCAAFSPDGQMLALGSRNNVVYLYQSAHGGFARVAKCTGHSSYVTHLDWAADSAYLRTNSGDYELLYWTASTGRQMTQPSQMRDVQWATHSCTLTFESVGIYPESADGTDVNTCCRSHDGRLMASGDDFGKVKLFSYPASQAKTHHQVCRGHSSHVTHVEFFSDDGRLLSAGGRDLSVLQWAVE